MNAPGRLHKTLVKRKGDEYRTAVDANRAALITQRPHPKHFGFYMLSSTEHDYAFPRQSANIRGDGSTNHVAGRDIIINNIHNHSPPADPPPVETAEASKPIKQRKPGNRASWWRLGGAGSVLAAALTMALQFASPDSAPARPDVWPEGKSALCNDGKFSPSQHRPGTCSGHDGVAFWRYPASHPYWHQPDRTKDRLASAE